MKIMYPAPDVIRIRFYVANRWGLAAVNFFDSSCDLQWVMAGNR